MAIIRLFRKLFLEKNNLTNFKFYDIIFIENKKRKKFEKFLKTIDNPKIRWYNKEKRKRGKRNGSIKKSRKRNVKK